MCHFSFTLRSFLISIPVLLASFLTACKKEKHPDVYDDPAYSMGTITTMTSAPFKVTYHYDFVVNGTQYDGKEVAKGIDQENKRLIGRTYLIVYEKGNIENNDLNFKYRIEDQAELDSLKKEFQDDPPEDCDSC